MEITGVLFPEHLNFSGVLVQNPLAIQVDLGSVPGWERSPGI